MKKILCALALAAILTGCSAPNSLQLDLSQGCGMHVKLLHLNASTQENRQRIEDFAALLEGAQPLDKDASLFAYYPDYLLEITHDGQKTAAIVDMNGHFLDFHYPDDPTIYRSPMTVEEFKKMLHAVY